MNPEQSEIIFNAIKVVCISLIGFFMWRKLYKNKQEEKARENIELKVRKEICFIHSKDNLSTEEIDKLVKEKCKEVVKNE